MTGKLVLAAGAISLLQNYRLVWGQNPQPDVTFEVASVKAVPTSVSQTPRAKMAEMMQDAYPLGFIPTSGPDVRIRSLSLASIVALGLHARRRDLIGPGWMSTEFFDIDAHPPRDAPAGTTGDMLRSLLVERFGLQYHREAKSEKGYALVVDGILRIQPSSQEGREELTTANKTPVDSPPAKDSKALEMARMAQRDSGEHTSFSSLTLKDATLRKLADALSVEIKATVADMTGLTEKYDFSLAFSSSVDGKEFDSPDVSLVRSLKELGLRLDRRTVSREVFVIDKIAKVPTGN